MASSQKKKKKQRCFAQDKFEHKFLKRADRWNGLGFSKQQQVYRDRNITVTAKEQTLVAQQQQLDADRQQLSSEEARLQATARQKFREADAAKLHAQRTTAWANNLVRTELGGNELSRALSLEARLVDTGYVDLPAARRAVAQKIAQEAVIDKSRLNVLPRGTSVWHFDREGRPRAATITQVHHDESPPYYAISFDGTTGSAPRETVRERLVPM